ncbi:MAG: transposase [Treponema sp.]|jgi:transposase|nr:transposase [Treponema sp.]
MGKNPLKPPEQGRANVQRSDNRQHDDESPPARRWAKRGQQTTGKRRAGISTKFHAVITSDGKLVEGLLAGGETHELKVAAELSRDRVGCAVIGDRGYDSDEFREELAGNNNRAVIPGRKNRRKAIAYDKEKYKKRGLIERVFGKLKENRRLALQYEKSDILFLGFICMAFIKIFLS